MSAKIKKLKQNEEVFFPVAVAKAVIFEDKTTAEIKENEMDTIFGWNRNYINLTEIEGDNYLIGEITYDESGQ